jgi:hypothetical protein
MISTYLYLYKHVLNDIQFILQREEKTIIFKTYIFVKLSKQDGKKKHTHTQFEDAIIQKN